MISTAVIILVTLNIGQMPAGLVTASGVFNNYAESATTGVTSVSNRIVSGWEAYPGQFPYVVALRSINPGGDVRECAGAVVHRNWVLTAAICTAARVAVVVRAGIIDLTTTPEYIFETTEWWIYPTFNLNRPNDVQPNDFSALKLQRPLVYSTLVQPILVQPSAEAFRDYSGEVFTASGWGRVWTNGDYPDVLNWVYLLAISNQDCRQVYGTSTVTENHICARAHTVSSQSTCSGDNGGSLVHINREGEPVLVGLAAFWNSAGCHFGYPAGFTRTGPFQGWLTEVTGLDFENLNEEDEITETPKPPTTEAPTTTTTNTTEMPEFTTTTTEVTELTPMNTEAVEQTTTMITDVPTPPHTEAPEPPTTEVPEPPTTEEPKPPITETPELSTTEEPKPPTTVAPESPTTEGPKPLTTEIPDLSTTEAPKPPATETPEPPTTEAPEPPTTEMTEPPTTQAPDTPITETPEPLSTETPEFPTTEASEPDSDDSDENSNDLGSSESKEDPEISQLIKKLQVKVKVKVKVNNKIKKKVKVKKNI